MKQWGVVVSIGLILAALGLSLAAQAAYDESADANAALHARLDSARLAATLMPWNERYAWRVATLQAEQLLDTGNIDAAFWLLQPLAQTVRGDALYTSVYRHAVALKTPLDARKAHVQHGKEGPGGVLAEEDVQH